MGNITYQVNTSNVVVVAEYNFDAWGRRRSADDWSYTLDGNDLALFADRGFTGHEYLPWFNLVNMNGRLYDPLVGRFLSADPYVQMPDGTQSYNRYSYCLNNPLRYTDPSGYKWKWLNPLYHFENLMQWINDNTTGLRKEMSDAGIPDFGVGVSVNGAGNVNVNGSYSGQEVFNTKNIDRSNAEQVVKKKIARVRQDYGQAWHAQSGGGDLATASFIAGAASLGYDSWQNLVYDGDHYKPTKGSNAWQKTSVWKMNKSGNYATRNGVRVPNSANAASRLMVTNAVKAGGVALNVVGLGFTGYDIYQNGLNISNGVDFVMGGVAFVPVWGWAVSGTYFLGKAGYEYYFTEP